MTDKIEQFYDKVSAMNNNAEYILNYAENTTNEEMKQTLTGIAQAIKGQGVIAEMLLEVLKSQNRTP